MPHSFSKLLFHVVFSTKDRARFMHQKLRSDLFAYMGGIVREMRGMARIVNGTEDHVHLLVTLPADVSIADCMRVVKANSSRWVHEKYPECRAFGWQTGYGAFAVSVSNQQQVLAYIQNQEEHHRRITFQEEFVGLLEKHGIAFDERYLWM